MCRFHTNRIFSRPSQVTSSLSKQPANLLQLLVDAKDCSENEDEGLSHMQGCPHIETSGEPLSAHPPFILVTHFPYHFSAYQSPSPTSFDCSSAPKIAVKQDKAKTGNPKILDNATPVECCLGIRITYVEWLGIYIYIYVYVCVCACTRTKGRRHARMYIE